jgi:DNA repair exonuclease SbcCD ATPase subunit
MNTQEAELGRLQEGRLQLQSARNNEDQRSHQVILELQQELDKRECELQRSKNETDLLHEMLKKLEEKCREGEAEMQEMLRRCASEAENVKKHEMQLKKVREDLKQLTWTSERELKKLLQAKLRALSESGEEGGMADTLKSVEEGVLEMLGRYDAI